MRDSREKDRAYKQKYCKANRAQLNQYLAEWRRKRKEAAVQQLGGKCVRCEATTGLHFDHIDPSSKLHSIGKILTAAEAVLAAEIQKCQLLCGPCHRAKTAAGNEQTKTPAQHGSSRMYDHYACRCEACRTWKREYYRAWRAKRKAARLHPAAPPPAPPPQAA